MDAVKLNGSQSLLESIVRYSAMQQPKLKSPAKAITGDQMMIAPGAERGAYVSYAVPNGKPVIYAGYQNKSRVMNLPPPHNFFWDDLGKGTYGMYVPLTTVETLNPKLLRSDVEQMHITMGHEYSLHHVMGLPDGYVVEALEEAMFWIGEEKDRYKP